MVTNRWWVSCADRGRTRLSCACRTADQIEAEDRRATGRLAMASVDTRAIEGEIDRIRPLGLEELRREWRRLNHAEPPRISRDLLVLALGYRLQEIAHGGLGKATRRKLQTMAIITLTQHSYDSYKESASQAGDKNHASYD